MNKIVVHIESGLGNQMLSYCEYLAIKFANPAAECYIETIIYDIPECNETICQWNGYELDRIFGISEPNIKNLFDDYRWNEIIERIRESRFWELNWNYPVYFTNAFSNAGLHLDNLRGDFESVSKARKLYSGIRTKFTNNTQIGNYLRRKLTMRYENQSEGSKLEQRLFAKYDKDVFTGQRLLFKYNGAGIEKIREKIKSAFVFPAFANQKNSDFAAMLDSCNSVFIHARRGDMLSSNGWCYKFGYFNRAVNYIKKNVKNPVFVFFTNTGSIEWCKENAKIFGLDYSKDCVYFVDWNTGDESYQDMQLMSHCKHGIITNSTFGWWGAYMIDNPNKITISPLAEINTTFHV